ncbi:MAG: smc 7, partial [Magnetococcales bacterium]|nr:smc 7 [Magnetococcales bacterium]
LRLGALEVLNQGRQPMPMVLDDILVHFDDQRAVAALKTVSSLKRQVLYFTHHPHIVTLATQALDSGSFGVHHL